MDWAAYLSYVVLNCITPGPNNMLSMSGAAQRGFSYSLRYICGVFIGFFIVCLLAGGFTALLYDVLPAIEPWLLALGAAYILYLAWLVWRSEPGEGSAGDKSRGVLSGIAMQFVNVKGLRRHRHGLLHPAALARGAARPALLAAHGGGQLRQLLHLGRLRRRPRRRL